MKDLTSKITQYLAIVTILFGASQVATASLIGDSVDCDIQPNGSFWSCSSAAAQVVDPGVEFTLDLIGTPRFEVDIAESDVLLTWIASGPFSLGANEVFTLSSLDWIDIPQGEIVDFTIATTLVGIDASDVTIGPHSLSIFLDGGVTYNTNDTILVELITNHVPAPATVTLLGLGLAGLAFSSRRRHKKNL